MTSARGIEDVVTQMVSDLLPDARVSWRGHEVLVHANGDLVCGVEPGRQATPREAVKLIGEFVQDGAIERLRRPVPECPGHPHPGVLRETDDGLAWVCPESMRVLRAYVLDA